MSDWTEYTIRAGERNFSPLEPFRPSLAREFEFWAAFHHSCYFSYLDDWQGDRDWFDANKLAMLTLAYTPNEHLAYGAGFMPGNISREVLVTPYTNYPGSNFVTRRTDSLPVKTSGSLDEAKAAGRVLYGRVTRNSRQVHYGFSIGGRRMEVAHDFRLPWYAPWISRWAGTWIGGEDNSPGEFGGEGKPGHEALAEKAGAMTMIQALRMNAGYPEGLDSAGRWAPVPRAVYDCLLPFFLAWQAMDGKEN